MTKWRTDEILADCRKAVQRGTSNWSSDQLREKLAEILASVHPLRSTLSGLIDNPAGPHSGMTITSGLFPEKFDFDPGLKEPWGAVYEDGDFKPIAFKWSEPQPDGLEHIEASFDGGETLHPDTPILSVWQYATACSIFIGSFDASDVSKLIEACRFGGTAARAEAVEKAK
jgi:hypothetical protein